MVIQSLPGVLHDADISLSTDVSPLHARAWNLPSQYVPLGDHAPVPDSRQGLQALQAEVTLQLQDLSLAKARSPKSVSLVV